MCLDRITSVLLLILCRRNVFGRLDIHPSRKAILVHYVAEAVVASDYGEPMVVDSKERVKTYVQQMQFL